jgi:(p)ppGpp synthase/HD superfamily hydrolase
LPKDSLLLTPRLELALRCAALGHLGQARKASGVPYFQHVVAVAWILERAGFDEDVVIAGLLHDLVEDTPSTLRDVEQQFGKRVAELVGHCTEVKKDAQGAKRTWIDRKKDHLEALHEAPLEARAVVLADKLHNLISIECDLRDGRQVWIEFNAPRDQVLWYYDEMITCCAKQDPRLEHLAGCCRQVLGVIESL